MKKYTDFINEGVRDKMTPISKEEINQIVSKMSPYSKIRFGSQNDIPDIVQEGFDSMGREKRRLSHNAIMELIYDAASNNYSNVIEVFILNYDSINYQDLLVSSIRYGSLDVIKVVEPYADMNKLHLFDDDLYQYLEVSHNKDCLKYVVGKSTKLQEQLNIKIKELEEEIGRIKNIIE